MILHPTEKHLIGQRIQSIREDRGLSQVQLATNAGLTRVTLAEVEKGTANPSIDTLVRICDTLGVCFADLFPVNRFESQRRIIMQPINGCFLHPLTAAIKSGTYSFLQILVAYAKASGIDLLTDAINTFRKASGRVEAYIGIDQKNTTADALFKLFSLCDKLYVIHDQAFAQTYHPKLYLLSNSDSAWLAVGSNNLTRGGLFTNFESSVIQVLDRSAFQDKQIYEAVQAALQDYCDSSLMREITSVENINALFQKGLVTTEQESRLGVRKSSISNPGGFGHRPVPPIPVPADKVIVPVGLFGGNGSDVTPKLSPGIVPADSIQEHGDSVVTAQGLFNAERGRDLEETYWFYAGKLTGGSRNILDLSESARLRGGSHPRAKDGRIPGGVAFFGVDPMDHNMEKHLTILYNGTRYFPSTIKYAPGNSNWRVQLKGDAETGGGSLSQLGEDFVEHILLFHKLTDDCYILETMAAEEMEALKARSRFWATNGNTRLGRAFGML